MNLRPKQGLAAAIALMSAAWTLAQTAPTTTASTRDATRGVAAAVASQPDPLDVTVPVRAAAHRSVLTTYRYGTGDASVGPWKDVNEAVGRIGGWRAYAREAAAAAADPAPQRPTAPGSAAPLASPAATSPAAAGASGADPKARGHHHHEGHGDHAVPRKP